ncbi:hypothetical protein ACTHGU_07005 [Chitinophagaceae bacterium MMS25-I14]
MLLTVLAGTTGVQAQAAKAGPETINQKDSRGERDGLWYATYPERMGEPAYTEFGSYDHGRKYGLWYKMDREGELMAIENFKNNTLNGESKYFEQGRLVCIGHYRGLNPAQKYDTIMVVNPETGAEKLVSISTERGYVRHGLWQYYDPITGRLRREEEYQVDELIYHKDFIISKEDSAYYQKKALAMPHNTGKTYTPPAGKRHSYTDYKGY